MKTSYDDCYIYSVKCANCIAINNVYIKKGKKLKDALFANEFFSYNAVRSDDEDMLFVEPKCYNCEESLKNNFEIYVRF